MPLDVVLIDDWRFPHEGNVVVDSEKFDVFTVRISAPEREILKDTPQYNDLSETALPIAIEDYDGMIFNSGDMDELKINCSLLFEAFYQEHQASMSGDCPRQGRKY
jgi:hypothetical protein